MQNPMINPQPNYSGVTIQISNPAVNVNPTGGTGTITNGIGVNNMGVNGTGTNGYASIPNSSYYGMPVYNGSSNPYINPIENPTNNIQSDTTLPIGENSIDKNFENIKYNSPIGQVPYQQGQMAYPPQYYLNNYNYQNNGEAGQDILKELQKINSQSNNNGIQETSQPKSTQDVNIPIKDSSQQTKEYSTKPVQPIDLTKSNNIIEDLDARETALAEEKKNAKNKNIVVLTDEYIKSLENYLNNPNKEIRLMASKEVIKRLDEDKNRYDDKALNALLNKMLQDPSKLIRIASLSAFSSQLASGNEYTVQLLQNIQSNPNSDKEDVLQAADILLKMSSDVEVKQIPNPKVKDKDNK